MADCAWPIDYGACGACAALEGLTPEQKATYEKMATDYLWNWTGKVYGTCPVAVRPCQADCAGMGYSTFWGGGPFPYDSAGGWYPVLVGGQWTNVSACGACGFNACKCGAGDAIRLPGPVASVTSVTIDGAVVPPTSYRIDNGYLLVRTDGETWPRCQDLDAEPTEPNTFQVAYERGVPVPVGGQIAAGVLACELAKAACGDKDCALPQRVQSITRQGVTIAVLDAFDDIDTGHTGIWIIDSWMASVTKPPRGGAVYSVDVPRPKYRVKTWP